MKVHACPTCRSVLQAALDEKAEPILERLSRFGFMTAEEKSLPPDLQREAKALAISWAFARGEGDDQAAGPADARSSGARKNAGGRARKWAEEVLGLPLRLPRGRRGGCPQHKPQGKRPRGFDGVEPSRRSELVAAPTPVEADQHLDALDILELQDLRVRLIERREKAARDIAEVDERIAMKKATRGDAAPRKGRGAP